MLPSDALMSKDLPSAREAFAPDLQPPQWFRVTVRDYGSLPAVPERKVVFHGVNKSGSLCVSKVVMDAYAAEARQAQFHSHYYIRGVKLEAFVNRIQETPGPGFFVGHSLFNLLPDDPQMIFVTQLRHPLPRLISCYEWIRRKLSLAGGDVEGLGSFEQFIRRGNGKSHSQVIQFATKFPEDILSLRQSHSASQLLERSLENIERHVKLCGIAELLEETIFVLAHLCGIQKVPAWKRDERNPDRPMVDTLRQSTIDLVQEVYQPDFELYQWAKKRFEEQLEKIEFGPELQAYQVHCRSQYKDRLLTTWSPDSGARSA